jgi:outer membrane protein TolC
VRETDEAGRRIATEAVASVTGATNDFDIARPSDRLRLRLLEQIELDAQTRALLEEAADAPGEPPAPPKALSLSLADALRAGAENDNGYQAKKEAIFLAALDLDLARHEFDNTFAGVLSGGVARDESDTDGAKTHETTLSGSAKPSVSRKFKNGANAMASLGLDIVKLLTGGRGRTVGFVGDFSATVPILRGAGRLIATEGLTQAERDLIYAVYDFEKYRQDYAVDVASAYYGLLKTEQNLIALRENGERLAANYRRAQLLFDAGRLSQVELDQTRQDLLSTGDKIVAAEKSRMAALDAFKRILGLPMEAEIALEMEELDALAESLGVSLRATPDEPTSAKTAAPDGSGGAPSANATPPGMRWTADTATANALSNRFDLIVSRMRLEDAERAVAIARDGLRASLGLKIDAGYNSSKPSGAARTDGNKLSAMLTSDLPWERTRERNAYRAALIALDAGRRALEAEEDAACQTIRDDIRQIRAAWSSLGIQREALAVAQRRVKSTTLFQQAGRSSTRDLLESEAALLSARNAVVGAIVDYRMAGLRLERDMSSLAMEEEKQ